MVQVIISTVVVLVALIVLGCLLAANETTPSPTRLHRARRRIQVHQVRAQIQIDANRLRKEMEMELRDERRYFGD